LIATYPPLERNVTCDVAIIGGGMTGAFVAQALCAAGVDVVCSTKGTSHRQHRQLHRPAPVRDRHAVA
jgi:glycerol-3-phosphate dehydrogenase